jgi:hypothetical protein
MNIAQSADSSKNKLNYSISVDGGISFARGHFASDELSWNTMTSAFGQNGYTLDLFYRKPSNHFIATINYTENGLNINQYVNELGYESGNGPFKPIKWTDYKLISLMVGYSPKITIKKWTIEADFMTGLSMYSTPYVSYYGSYFNYSVAYPAYTTGTFEVQSIKSIFPNLYVGLNIKYLISQRFTTILCAYSLNSAMPSISQPYTVINYTFGLAYNFQH